ncbi:MAG: HAMP domain-containing protein, partial [Chloroflexota bacterium]
MKFLLLYINRLSLGSKLAILASLLIVLVVAGLTYLGIEREQRNFMNEVESQADVLLEILPLMMRDQLYRLEIDELTTQSTQIAVGTAALGAIIAFIISRGITTPLRSLTESASKMATDEISTSIDFPQMDKIGELGNAFNQMADAIQTREQDLVDLAAGLENS